MAHSRSPGLSVDFSYDWTFEMWWLAKVALLLGILLAGQSAWAFADGLRFLRRVRGGQLKPRRNYTPPTAVVIPCKGVDAEFDSNLDRILYQDYPDHGVVFAVATEGDAAYLHLRARLETRAASGSVPGPPCSLVVAGLSDRRGEKVNNLLRGVAVVDRGVQALVFADIGMAPSTDWLRSLVAPLANPQITVSTGFRWYLPGEGFVSRLRAAWDTSIATMMRDDDPPFAWGGSMAIRSADFHRLGIAERHWASTVSDDYALTRAVREAGGRIAFEPRCLVASREELSLREFLGCAGALPRGDRRRCMLLLAIVTAGPMDHAVELCFGRIHTPDHVPGNRI